MSVYLEIRDTDNNIESIIDVGNSEDNPFTLTRKLSDGNDFTKKAGTYSNEFEIPVTYRNAQVFKGIDNANSLYLKQLFKFKTCNVVADEVVISTGNLKALSTSVKNGVTYIKLRYVGDNITWLTEMREMSLSDVYSGTLFNYSSQAVIDSWTNTADDSDFVFALIDRGDAGYGTDNAKTYLVREFRPDLWVKGILDNAFESLGYTIESAFFDTSAFKTLILPYFGTNEENWLNNPLFVTNNSAEIERSADLITTLYDGFIDGSTGSRTTVLPLNQESDPNNIYDNTIFKFSNFNVLGSWTFNYNFEILFEKAILNKIVGGGYQDTTYDTWTSTDTLELEYVHVNGNQSYKTRLAIVNVDGDITISGSENIDIYSNSEITFRLIYTRTDSSFKEVKYKIKATNNILAKPTTEITAGTSLDLGSLLPRNYYVLDLINDLTKMFNLFWQTNNVVKTIKVEPKDDYLLGTSDAIDFTDKLDLSKGYTLKSNKSVYKRLISFKYREDGNDGYLTGFNEARKNLNYGTVGDYIEIDLGDEFEDGEKTIELDKVSATVSPTLFSEKPVTAIEWSAYTTEPDAWTTKYAPRILSYRYATQPALYTDFRTLKLRKEDGSIHSQTLIPYATMATVRLNNELVAPVSFNLTFHDTTDENGNTVGLVRDYYAKTIDNIINGGLLECNLVMSNTEFKTIDFRKPLYFSAPEKLSGYWYILEIKNKMFGEQVSSVKCVLSKLTNGTLNTTGIDDLDDDPNDGIGWSGRPNDYPTNSIGHEEVLGDFGNNNSGTGDQSTA